MVGSPVVCLSVLLAVLAAVLLLSDSAESFAPVLPRCSVSFRRCPLSTSCTRPPRPSSSPFTPFPASQLSRTTALWAKAWNVKSTFANLGIEPDVEHKWYCLKTRPGYEEKTADLLRTYLNTALGSRKSDVRSIVVPTSQFASSRGKKVFVSALALLPSYIFISLRLNPATHDAVLSFPPITSFVGARVTRWAQRVPRSVLLPAPLPPEECVRLERLAAGGDDETILADAKREGERLLKGLPTPGELVRVLRGNLEGETGKVSSVRGEEVRVKLFMNGRVLDQVFPRDVVRTLTPEETEERMTEMERKGREKDQFEQQLVSARLKNDAKINKFERERLDKLREDTDRENKLSADFQKEEDRWMAFQRTVKEEEEEEEEEGNEEEDGSYPYNDEQKAETGDAAPAEFDFSVFASKDLV